jgi:hypothetical protein
VKKAPKQRELFFIMINDSACTNLLSRASWGAEECDQARSVEGEDHFGGGIMGLLRHILFPDCLPGRAELDTPT